MRIGERMNQPLQEGMSVKKYFLLNKATCIYCFRVSSIVIATTAIIGTGIVEWKTGVEENPLTIFIACVLYGYGFGIFILVVAFIDGYVKVRSTLRRFNRIDDQVKRKYSVELVRKPLNPKLWFLQFQIIYCKDDDCFVWDE